VLCGEEPSNAVAVCWWRHWQAFLRMTDAKQIVRGLIAHRSLAEHDMPLVATPAAGVGIKGDVRRAQRSAGSQVWFLWETVRSLLAVRSTDERVCLVETPGRQLRVKLE
jgi:hypothetical protein